MCQELMTGMSDIPVTHTAPSTLRKNGGCYLGIVLFAVISLWPTPEGMRPEAKRMAATVALMGCWWIGESLPLGVTALEPLKAKHR